MNLITLTQDDMKKYEIIQKTINGGFTNKKAAEKLSLSVRQIQRIKKVVDKNGIEAVIHKSRGKTSNRKTSSEVEDKIVKKIKKKYPDFGPTLATEKLIELDNIKCKTSTVRNIMIRNDIWTPKKAKPPTHRTRRIRRSSYGEMIQYDGSYHLWLEDRGIVSCLLLAVDDATGTIIHGKFDTDEGVLPTFSFWHEYMLKYGIPESIYHDRFSTYSMNHKTAKENPDTKTQFQRAMTYLNVECIEAGSSQAKGRVENFFGTLQDRLVKEMRLKGISTIEEANKFLVEEFIPNYNKKFAVVPRKDGNLHTPLNKEKMKELPSIFSRHDSRVVANDFTIRFNNIIIQLKENQPFNIYPKDIITVESHIDKSIYLRKNKKYLNFQILEELPKKLNKKMTWVLAKNTIEETSPLKN
jgi:transposase